MEECYSGVCEVFGDNKSYCVGKPFDSSCELDLECDRGDYCHSEIKDDKGVCRNLVGIGQVSLMQLTLNCAQKCNKTERCVIWGMCNNGQCIQKRSLKVGEVIESEFHKELCYTRASFKQANGVYQCAAGLYLDRSHVRKNANDTCKYHRLGGNDGSEFIGEPSACGYSKHGIAFCDVKEGDEVYLRTLQIVADYWDK